MCAEVISAHFFVFRESAQLNIETMSIQGKNYVGFSLSAENSKTFQSYVPATDQYLPETFHSATPNEVTRAMQLAEKAADEYALLSSSKRADFLMAITEEIMAAGDELLERAHLETGLPLARLQGERARTINQLDRSIH
jgi:alpha-ketoglutaric semialdehyde dehydrogenase